VNKEHFNNLLKDYSNLDSQYKELESLMRDFPYSHPVRMLNVKSSSSLSKKEYQQRIALTAFYVTDRNVLRSLIEKGKVPSDIGSIEAKPVVKEPTVITKPLKPDVKTSVARPESTTKKPVAKTAAAAPKTVIKKAAKALTSSIDAESLRKEVLVNLEILQQTKSAFLKLAKIDTVTEDTVERPASIKSKTAKKIAKKKVAEPVKPAKAKSVQAKPATAKAGKTPKTKKNELIDKFIADAPSITPGKAVKENQSDLSKASSELKEDLVSENLAIIFAKQGKASKAIEIYKKLIWKFPQKKTSFAARIEELKNK